MKKLSLLLTICLALSIWAPSLYATHLMGADMTWTIVGPHQYIITLDVYRDCNSTVVQPTSYQVSWKSVTCSDTGGFYVNVASGYPQNATDTCPSEHSTCDGGTVYGVQKWEYVSGVVNLPANCPDVILGWASGNRNVIINNLTTPGNDALYISAEINTSLIDNSPQFLNPLTVDLCLDQTNYVNQGGYDPDGDSLVYVLDTAQGAVAGAGPIVVAYPYVPVNLAYTAGYTPTDPITNTYFNFNSSTGQITVFPTQSEYDVVKLVVYEYRAGILVGHVERDMQVEIASCADTLPSVSGIDSITSRDSVYTITPCTSSCFTVYSFASDTNKTLTLTITGQSSFPGATFTVGSGKHPTLTFCWTPTRADAGTFRFYVTVKDNNCPQPGSNTQSYTVIVPEIYPAGPDQTICLNNAVHADATGVGTWSIQSGNPATTVIASPTSTTTLITGFTVAGRYNYIWMSDTLCVDTMSVFVNSPPNAGPDQTICQNSTATMAATAAGGIWHALSTNPAPTVIADTFLINTTVTGFTVLGTYKFRYTVNGCSDTMEISVVLKPNAGPDQTICSSSGTVTMAASGTGPWTASSSNPDSTHITTPTSPTTTITGLTTVGTYTYYWGSGCEDTVLITVAAAPDGGPAQTICQYNTVRMGATGSGTWTSLSTNPATTVIVTPTSDSTVITGFTAAGTYHFVWSVGTGCTDTVAITVTAKPNAGPDQSICLNSIATMAATGTGTWTKSSSNPDSTHITNTTSPTTTITNFGVIGVYTYYWTANGCTDTVQVTVNAIPNAGPDQSLCAPGTITTAATGTGTWSALSSNPGTTTITSIHSAITTITGFSAGGTYTYVWTNNGCTDSMNVLVTPINSAGPDQTICQYNTVTTASIGTGTWSILSTNPATTVIANLTRDTTTITGFTVAGTYGYVWSSSICTDTMFVTVTAKPNAGPDQSTCQYSTATMAAVGTGTWTALSTNPATTTIVTPASATTEITGFTVAGTYSYVWTSNGCTDTANVIVTAKPNAGTDQTICQYTTATMTATGRGVWSTPATGNPAVVTFANDTVHNTVVSGFTAAGTYTLIWSFGGCSDTVLVHVTAKPNAGPDQTTCQFSTAVLDGAGTGTWTALSTNPATTTIVTPASSTTQVTGFTVAGTYGYVWTSNGCTDTADVIVTAKPNAGSDQTICQYTTTALAATGRGTWTTAPGNPAVITFANDTVATTSVSGFTAAGNYILIWTLNGCSDSMQIHVTAKPNAGPDETTCQFSTVNMAATGAGTWTILPGNPATTVIVTPTSPTTEITGFTVAGRYGYIWTDSSCTDTAYVTVTAKPNAGPDQTICQYTTTVLAATGSGTWTTAPGNPAVITFANDTVNNTVVSGFTAAGTYTLIWSLNGCSDTMLVHVTAKPNAGPNETTCQFSTVIMGATGTGVWSALSGNPATTTIVSPDSAHTEITGFTVAGTYSYVWTSNGCTDTANVVVNPKPNAGTPQTICQYTTAIMTATGTGTWTHAAGNPATVTFTTPTSPTTVATGFTVAGVYTLIWTSNGCADSVLITVTPKPNAGPDQTTCQFSTATMAATGTGVWTALSTNPDTTIIISPDSAHTEITGFDSAGTYSFVWTSNGCTDTANVIVHPKPNAGPDQYFCIPGSTTLDATGGPGIWTALSTDSPSTIVSPTSDTTVVNGFTTGGYYSYIWTVNGCADTMVVTVYPTDPAGPNQTVCQYDTVKTASFGAGTWIALSTNPNPTIIADSILDTTAITGFTVPGVYGFVWLVNPCTDTMYVTVVAKPNAGPDQTTCQYSTATMAGTGTGTWTAMSGNPDSTTITTPTSPNTVITGFDSAGTYNYIWTANGCTDTASVIVTAKPNAGSDQTICQFTTTTLAATGRGTWTTAPGNPAVITFTNDTLRNTSVSGFTVAGNYILIWSFAGCSDSIEIHVTAKPNAGPDQTTCQFSTATMAASGAGTWTAMTGNPHTTTIVTPTSPTTEITGFTVAGNYSYIWTDSSCSDTAVVTVVAKPNAGSDQTICQFTTTTLAATGHGTWTTAPGNPAVITFANDTVATTSVSGFTVAGNYLLIWSFNGCSDTMQVHVTPKPNAGPDQTTCQFSTAVLDAAGSGTWTILPGNPATTVIVTPTSPTTEVTGFAVAGTYGYIWTDSSCTDTAYVTVIAKPNAGSDQTICQYTTTTLAATGSGTWTTAPGNPAVITFANDTVATTSVSGFTVAGNYILIWSFNGCSDSMEIHVTAKPNAGPDQTTCQFSTVNMAATGAGTWSAMSGNPATTVIVTPASPNTEITGFTVAGTYSYIWTDSSCTDTATVTVNPKPDAGPDQTICQYTTTVMAATGSGLWTASAGNPAVVTFANDTVYNTTVSGFSAAGTYALYWTLNGCSDTVLVNVTAKPNAGPDQTTCQFSTATMAATGTGTWTALSTNPVTTTIVTPTSPNTEITGFDSAGTYSYVWTSNGCTDTANVIVNQKSNGGPNQSFCLPGSTSLDGLDGPGLWTALSSNPGSSTIVSPTSDTTVVNGITLGGFYYYIWTVNGCADTVQVIAYPTDPAGPDQTICQYNAITTAGFGPGTWVALSNNPNPTVIADSTADTTAITGFNVAGTYGFIWEVSPCTDTLYVTVTAKPDAGPDQTTCQYSTATMAGTGTGTWTPFLTNPATTVIVSPTSPVTEITGFTVAGTYSYIWTNNGCTDTANVIVTAKPDAGPDQTICQYSTTTMAATGTGTWTAEATNPAVVTFVNTTSPTTSVSGFTAAGNYLLYWSLNGCSDTIVVTVTAKPDAGPDQVTCQYSTAVMAATGTGTWTAMIGNPATTVIVTPASPNTEITGFVTAGTYSYIWTNNGCADTAIVTVTAKPNAGPDQTICQYETTTMSATGSGTWTLAAGNPSVLTITNTTSPTTTVSGFSLPGTDTLYWSLNGCSDTVLIAVTAKPNAGPDQNICQSTTATMAGSAGAGTWTQIGTSPAVATITTPGSPTTTITGFTVAGTYSFIWTVNGCADTMNVVVSEASTLTVDGAPAICLGVSDTLTAVVTVPGGTYLWSPGGATTASIIVSPATAGTYTYTVTYTLPVCGAVTAAASITVYPAMTLTTENDTICDGSPAHLSTTPSTAGGSYLWTPGNLTTQSITVTPATLTIFTVTYTLAGCPVTSVNDTVNVTVPPTVSLTGGSICLGDSMTLTATPSQAGGTYTWSPGGATTQGITVSPATTTTYTVSYAIPGSVCPPTTATATVNVTPQPTVSVNDTSVCQGQDAYLTATPSITGGTYVWTPGGYTTQNISVSPPANATYSVTYTIAGCGSATGSGTVTVNDPPVINALNVQPITCYDSTNGTLTPVITPAGGAYTYAWSNGETSPVDMDLAAGSYTLTITDANGCTATSALSGTIPAAPAQAFAEVMPNDITVLQDSSIQLATSFGPSAYTITGYSWTPTAGLSCTTCPNPIVNTTDATDTLVNYTVTVMYNNGCYAYAYDTIHVESGMAIGNAFTPNGDGKNDFFTIMARGANTFSMTIYNRWGQQMYSSNDITAGWDGTYKGSPQPSGDYIYYVEVTFLNGQTVNRTGTVTLLR